MSKSKNTPPVNPSVQNCMFDVVGVKHSPETAQAIGSVADAIKAQASANEKTASALEHLAKSISGGSVNVGPCVAIGAEGNFTVGNSRFTQKNSD